MIIQDYFNFTANGLNDLLSETEKQEILNLQQKLHELYQAKIKKQDEKIKEESKKITFTTTKGQVFSRKMLLIDEECDLFDLFKIFTSTESQKIWFLNKSKKLCLLQDSAIKNGKLYVHVIFDVKGYKKDSYMSLNRFLQLIEIGDFKITNKKFSEVYLKPLSESNKIKKLDADIKELELKIKQIEKSDIYKKYDTLYENQKHLNNKEMSEIRKQETREVPQASAIKKKAEKINKKVNDVKSIWNSTIMDSEKAELIGWFARHIVSMKIKVVDKGVSDKIISKAYPDEVYGKKYREKANSSGWDAASGSIIVDSVENAPIETIKKLSTIKHLQRTKDNGETVFKGKTINNLDLVLFLLSKYNKYGFKTGEKLNIDVARLSEEEFDNSAEFACGFIGC